MNVNVIPLALLLRTRFRDETSASFRKHRVHLGFTTLACASMNRGGRRVVHDRHAANEACFRERYKTDEMENGRVTRCGGLSMGKDERIGLVQLRADPVTGKPQWRTGPERPQAGRVKLLSNTRARPPGHFVPPYVPSGRACARTLCSESPSEALQPDPRRCHSRLRCRHPAPP